MLTALSGVAAAAPRSVAASQPPAPAAASTAAAATSRATAQDRVTISPAGQQAAKATQDVDHDGDSH